MPKEINGELNTISELVSPNLDWGRIKEENESLIRKLPRKRHHANSRGSGATRQPRSENALHATALPGCARPSASGVIKACRLQTNARLFQISSQMPVH